MGKKKNRVLIWKLIGMAIVAWTLAGIPAPLLAGKMAAGPVDEAIAVLHPTANSDVSGFVSFTRKGDGVQISASVEGLNLVSTGSTFTNTVIAAHWTAPLPAGITILKAISMPARTAPGGTWAIWAIWWRIKPAAPITNAWTPM